MESSGYRNRCEMARGPKTCILEAKNAVLGLILGPLEGILAILAAPKVPRLTLMGGQVL